MKLKLGELVQAKDGLVQLSQKELPIKSAYKISRILKAASSELENYEEQRTKLIKKLGKEEGGNISVPPEKKEEFIKELEGLLEVEVDINAEKIDVKEFGNISISPGVLVKLDPFFE